MNISWGILIPALIIIGILYFVVRSRRKGRGTAGKK
jgi:cbb3-type cytochrome oxidase subunit 3